MTAQIQQNITKPEKQTQKPQYVTYTNPQEFNRHFKLCRRREIPFLAVCRRGTISSRIEFDLVTAESVLNAFGYEDLLALRDDLFERKLTRDVITSRVNGVFKVKRECEAEVVEKLWRIITSYGGSIKAVY